MADIKNIDVYQTVSSVSFEVEPITNIININKVTIEGAVGGSQDLQEVTDIGATTTNTISLNPTVNTNGLNINTTFDENISGASTAVNINQTGEGNGIYINTPNGKALEILGGGNGTGITVNGVDNGVYLSPITTGIIVSGGSSESINITNTSGVGIRVYQNIESANELNLGTTAKGLVINSGTSSTGNFIELAKNSVNKLSVNQQGELTATKLIKQGGTSSQYLMADGSISTGGSGGGIKNTIASGTDTYTATISGVTSYTDGDAYLVRFTNGNTTNCSININSLGVIALYRNNDGALIGGDIQSGGEMLCVYNSTLNAFQCIGTSPNDIISYVTNADSVTITKGQPVYAFGGVGDRMTVKLAYNTLDSSSAQTVGLVMSASIAAGQKGIIITQGQLDGLNTLSTFNDGDTVYLGATAGTITNVKPYAPNHLVYLGIVTTKSLGSAGRMYVRVQNGYELDELHNVQAQSPTLKDTLYFDNTVTPNQWKTASISTILGYTPVQSNTAITGATKTKITYDTKGLVTSGVDATTADIVDSTDKRYVSDAQKIVIGNTSGTNTGDNATNTQYSGLATSKQDTLVSTTNIKSINGNSILGSGNLVISASTPSQSAFTVLANNTNASAVPTEQVFKSIAEQTFPSGNITWTGTTNPSGTTAHTYTWNQIGNLVTIRINLSYTVAGSAITSVACVLPSDLPTPALPSSVTTNLDTLNYGSGVLSTAKASLGTPVATYTSLRLKTLGTPNIFEIVIARASGAFQYGYSVIQYFV